MIFNDLVSPLLTIRREKTQFASYGDYHYTGSTADIIHKNLSFCSGCTVAVIEALFRLATSMVDIILKLGKKNETNIC